MEQRQNNTKQGYEHVKERERYKMEVLLERREKVREIARHLGRHGSTIYREKRKGRVTLLKSDLREKERYRVDVAQSESERRGKERERTLKIGWDKELEKYIRERIKERHSPDAILVGIRRQWLKFLGMICTKILYNYIERGVFAGISNEQLWEKGRRKRTYRPKVRVGVKNRLGSSIEERDEEIERREEYGHWEGDTVKGEQGGRAVLLTLSERVSREECIVKLAQGTQAAVKQALDSLEAQLGDRRANSRASRWITGVIF